MKMYTVIWEYDAAEDGAPQNIVKQFIGCASTKDEAIKFCDEAKLNYGDELIVYEVPVGLPNKFNGCEDYQVVYRKESDITFEDMFEYEDFVKEKISVIRRGEEWEVIDNYNLHIKYPTLEEAMDLANGRMEALLQMYIKKDGYRYRLAIDRHPNIIYLTGTCEKED
jgi:hypothetical protein